MLILHIMPLDILPFFTSWNVLNVLELILNIGGPCNICFINADNVSTITLLFQYESIIEKTLGNESARDSWISWFHFLSTDTLLLVFPEITDSNDWITVREFLNGNELSI